MSKKFPTTLEDWLTNQFSHNELVDICQHGAISGFHGLIYYSETSQLYDVYHEDIWAILREEYDMFDQSSCLSYIASFQHAKDVESDAQWKNLLVWYAVENLAYRLTQGRYYRDDAS
ncbi:MAG: hypothetical protein GY821_02625 [Gammaproteobacteria bacterium]|nr:hypothetical protein [Gammaproteobacteria bacterium]